MLNANANDTRVEVKLPQGTKHNEERGKMVDVTRGSLCRTPLQKTWRTLKVLHGLQRINALFSDPFTFQESGITPNGRYSAGQIYGPELFGTLCGGQRREEPCQDGLTVKPHRDARTPYRSPGPPVASLVARPMLNPVFLV